MLTCSVCGTENDGLALTCVKCRSYLQGKIENLDLFRTLWGLAESPFTAFKRICLARTKNYVTLLDVLCGIALCFALFWWKEAGKIFSGGLPAVLGMGVAIGIPAGLLALWTLAAAARLLGRPVGGTGTIRNLHAVLSYAGAPLVLSLVFVFPLEIALFGIYLFDHNPSPFVLKPVPYVALAVIDGLAGLWTCTLAVIGVAVAHQITLWRAAAIMGALAAAGAGMLKIAGIF